MRGQTLISNTLPSFALVLGVLSALPSLALVSRSITDYAPFLTLLPGLITTLISRCMTDYAPFLTHLPATIPA